MKILFLTPYTPSRRAGGENFTRLLLQDLSKSNDIDLIYYKYKNDETYVSASNRIRIIKIINNSVAVKLVNFLRKPFVHPIFSIRFNYNLLKYIKLQIQKEKYDLLFLDHSQMFLYGYYLKEIPKIMMAHDVMGQRYERQGNAFMRWAILKTESRLMNLPNTTVFSFSNKDKDIIQRLYKKKSEVTHFFIDDMVVNAIPKNIKNRLIFFGKWKRADNFDGLLWFFEHVYFHLEKNTEIIIIGGWLSNEFQNRYVDGTFVKYWGFVENPYPIIANSMGVLSPLFSGAGVKVKVVESLACGTPVIGNEIAFEGIGKEYSNFMFTATTIDDYVKHIEYLKVIKEEERLRFKTEFFKHYSENSITEYLKSHYNN